VLGAFIGAAVFQVIQLFGAAFFAGVWKLLLGATLIAVILAAPTGITGMLPLTRRAGRSRKVRLRAVPERA
jgi:ABC-type branched-subunit amino acid transport system permease subunit